MGIKSTIEWTQTFRLSRGGEIIRLQFYEPNENSEFIKRIIELIYSKLDDVYWSVSDLDLVPKVSNEYSGTGESYATEVAWNLYKKIQRDKVEFLCKDMLADVLNDTATIRNAVLLCFSNEYERDYSIRARVEGVNHSVIQNEKAILEIRILDGDLFTILCRDSNIEKELALQFSEFQI